MTAVEAVVCLGKGLCNCKKVLREVSFDTACSKMCSFLNVCHDDEWKSNLLFVRFVIEVID